MLIFNKDYTELLNPKNHLHSAAGQGRIIKRVRIPPRKVGQPSGSESLEAAW